MALANANMTALYAYCALIIAGLLLPILVVVAGSFTAGGTIAFPPHGLSLRWYHEFLADPDFIASAWVSLQVASAVAVIATLLGTAAAIALRTPFPGRQWAETFLLLPLGIPGVVLGLAFLVLYTQMGFGGTISGIIAGHVVFTTPFVLRLVTASLTHANPNLERAASGLGASAWRVFWFVTLPGIRAGIIGGAVFATILSFDEVVISLFLSGPDAITLPVRIVTYVDQSPGPLVLAAGTFLVGFAVLVFALLEATVTVSRAFGLSDNEEN
jgi:putative spermidine/putrescine transport system permease protein